MRDTPQVDDAALLDATAMQEDEEGVEDGIVRESDLSRFRSTYDKKLAEAERKLELAQRAGSVERKNAQRLEQELNELRSYMEQAQLATMSPEDRKAHEAKQQAEDARRLREENQRLRKQQELDQWRDQLLVKYGLRGDEDGLDYANPLKFAESVVAVSTAERLNKQTASARAVKERVEQKAKAPAPAASAPAKPSGPKVETGGPTGVGAGSAKMDIAYLDQIQRTLQTGTPQERKAAREELRKRRASVSV
jgi:hypothetical protein